MPQTTDQPPGTSAPEYWRNLVTDEMRAKRSPPSAEHICPACGASFTCLARQDAIASPSADATLCTRLDRAMFPQRLKELGDELPAGFYNQRWVSQCYALACDQSAAIREATTRIEELKSELAIAEHDHALKDAYIKKLQELLNFAIQSLEALQPILGTSIGEQVQSIVDKIVKGTK